MSDSIALANELRTPFVLTREQIMFYRENGYIKLRQVLSAELLRHYSIEISQAVSKLNTQRLPLEKRSTYDKAFLQTMNLWTESEVVREFVFSTRLARIATELMGCRGVRIYHDQALYKEPGGGITPWHADQYYFPVSNDNVTTAWVPLQDIPLAMGPLAFCEKSHRVQRGRDLAISDESESTLKQVLNRFHTDESPFDLGDVSFHAGWTFHRAGPNVTEQMRKVMTVIYIDQDMRLAQPKNTDQFDDLNHCPGIQVGEVIASHLNPVIFSHQDGQGE